MAQGTPATLRLLGPEDDAVHALVHAAATAAQWAGSSFDADQRSTLVQMQSNAQVQQYRDRYPEAAWHVIELDGELAGRLIIEHQDTALHVVDVVLLASAQGRGIGAQLLTDLHRTASEHGVPVSASVLAGNSGARALYARLGFRELPLPNDDPGLLLHLEWPPGPGPGDSPED